MSNFLNLNVTNCNSPNLPLQVETEAHLASHSETDQAVQSLFAQAKQEIASAAEQVENKSEDPPIEKHFTLHNIDFYLSDEMINNMSGFRGASHYISQGVLRRALNKKTNAIKKLEKTPDFKKNNRFDWYFRTQANKIYNLVIQVDHRSNRYVVLTGYTMPDNVAKQRHSKMCGASNYQAWVQNLPAL